MALAIVVKRNYRIFMFTDISICRKVDNAQQSESESNEMN